MISGILVSPGFAFGQALILKEDPITVSTKKITDDQIETEIQHFIEGRNKSAEQLSFIKERAEKILVQKKLRSLKAILCCWKMKSLNKKLSL